MNVFESWVEFRKIVKKEERAKLVEFINSKNQTNISSPLISQYIKGRKAAPDNILKLIQDDFLEFLPWILTRSNICASDDSIKKLSEYLMFPIKE
jgi:hypothetical protein